MNQDTLIEIAKIIIPALVSSSLVSYFFQKKLQRLQNYETVTKAMLERMLNGIEDIFGIAQAVQETLLEIKTALEKENTKKGQLERLTDKLSGQANALKEKINMHRIYITPLIPFGTSKHYGGVYLSVVGALQVLNKISINDSPESFEKDKQWILDLIEKASDIHTKLQEQIIIIKKKILNGEVIY